MLQAHIPLQPRTKPILSDQNPRLATELTISISPILGLMTPRLGHLLLAQTLARHLRFQLPWRTMSGLFLQTAQHLRYSQPQASVATQLSRLPV